MLFTVKEMMEKLPPRVAKKLFKGASPQELESSYVERLFKESRVAFLDSFEISETRAPSGMNRWGEWVQSEKKVSILTASYSDISGRYHAFTSPPMGSATGMAASIPSPQAQLVRQWRDMEGYQGIQFPDLWSFVSWYDQYLTTKDQEESRVEAEKALARQLVKELSLEPFTQGMNQVTVGLVPNKRGAWVLAQELYRNNAGYFRVASTRVLYEGLDSDQIRAHYEEECARIKPRSLKSGKPAPVRRK